MSFETVETVYGLMPSQLSCASLKDLCVDSGIQTGPFGSQLHQEDYVQNGTPIITVEHLGENRIVHNNLPRVSDEDKARLAKYVLKTGDIVFSRVGSVDRRALVQPAENGWLFSGRCLRVRSNPEQLDAQWLSYFFGLPAFKNYIRGIAVGATMPSLNTKILSDVPVYFPDLSTQKAAAEVLAKIDDRITLLRETNTTLEAIAQALFKSWFVDFDPVHAKMQGRAPEGMDEATAALFPDSFEESELGAVPKGWRVGNLNALADLNPESWSAKLHPERVLYVDLANTKAGQIDEYNEFSFEDAPSRARRVLRCGDVIVGTVRPGNRSFARIASDVTGLTGSTGFAVLRSREVVDQALVYIAATNDEAIDRLSHLADGGAYPAVRPEVVGSTPLVIATEEIRNSFGDITNPLFASIGANQERMTQLASLRDTLLPRLISGQLILNDYQATLAA